MQRGLGLTVLAVLAVALGAPAVAASTRAQSPRPTAVDAEVRVSPAAAAPGEQVLVELVNWPDGPALVGVCGNSARRGSEDCNLAGTEGIDVVAGRATFRLRVSAPPIHCPCVIRATTPDTLVVRQAPFAVTGLPDGPELLPAPIGVSSTEVAIRARLEDADRGLIGRALPLVAGPVHMTLVMTVRNDSDRTIEEIRVVGAVGRKRSDAEPIASATIDALPSGTASTVRIPVRIGVPAWGRYEVFGSVYGLDVPGRFSATTTNDPWGLQLVIPVVLLLLAWWAHRREDDEAAMDTPVEEPVEEPVVEPAADSLRESSPAVGAGDEGRSPAPSYAPTHGSAT